MSRGAARRVTTAARVAAGATAQGIAGLRAGLDAAVTVEAAGVTLIGAARDRGVAGALELGPEIVRFLRAAQCEDEAHYHYLLSIGAVPAAAAFTLPEVALVDREAFLRTLAELEGIAVGATMAIGRRFAELGDPGLVEIAYQQGAVDAQHEALARHLLGLRPANDRAFARWRFVQAGEALAALRETGLLEGDGEAVAFPGPVPVFCSGVFGLVPETTEEALAFVLPAVEEGAVGSPVAEAGGTPVP